MLFSANALALGFLEKRIIDSMKQIIAVLFLLFSWLANSLSAEVSSPTKEAFESEQRKVVEAEIIKDVWTLDAVVNGNTSASVNGQITWGDRLRIRLNKDFCMEGNLVTSFILMKTTLILSNYLTRLFP